MKRAMGPGEFTRGEKEMVAAAVSGVNACEY
jgi:AhpD family alkylhydroperoxidase